MKLIDISWLKPGVMLKGIDNSTGGSILSLDGWNNKSFNKKYIIRWIPDEEVREVGFVHCEHNKELGVLSDDGFTTPNNQVNGLLYVKSSLLEPFNIRTLIVSKTIVGVFLGESVFIDLSGVNETLHRLKYIILLKVLGIDSVGWIVLAIDITDNNLDKEFHIL